MPSPLSREVIGLIVIELNNRGGDKKLDEIITRLDRLEAKVDAISSTVGADGMTDDQTVIDAATQNIEAVTLQLKTSSDRLSQAIQKEQNP